MMNLVQKKPMDIFEYWVSFHRDGFEYLTDELGDRDITEIANRINN